MARVPQRADAERSSSIEQPKVTLLDEEQWLYVQDQYGLTPRERQIAELVCQGLGNATIDRSLRVKPGTVKTHVRNIYCKVRVSSKIAMLLKFVSAAKVSSRQGFPARLPDEVD